MHAYSNAHVIHIVIGKYKINGHTGRNNAIESENIH